MRAEDLEALREHMLAVIAATAFALRGTSAFDERVMTAMGKVPRHAFVPIETSALRVRKYSTSNGVYLATPAAGLHGGLIDRFRERLAKLFDGRLRKDDLAAAMAITVGQSSPPLTR